MNLGCPALEEEKDLSAKRRVKWSAGSEHGNGRLRCGRGAGERLMDQD